MSKMQLSKLQPIQLIFAGVPAVPWEVAEWVGGTGRSGIGAANGRIYPKASSLP